MLTYTPGDSAIHRLDPRAKLFFQFAFAAAAFLGPSVPRLVALFALGVGCLQLAGLAVRRVVRTYWIVLVVLSLGPLIAGLSVGTPGLSPARARDSLQSVARVVPVLLVSAAYVHTTPVRETRAAIQRTVPGRTGQLLGTGVGLTFRFLPVVRADLRTIRDAIAARGGDRRPIYRRASRIATLAVGRALDRSDQLSVALQARCFAWNPTLPPLSFDRRDYLVVVLAFGLLLLAVLGL
jgi:biotin transport system permease protein